MWSKAFVPRLVLCGIPDGNRQVCDYRGCPSERRPGRRAQECGHPRGRVVQRLCCLGHRNRRWRCALTAQAEDSILERIVCCGRYWTKGPRSTHYLQRSRHSADLAKRWMLFSSCPAFASSSSSLLAPLSSLSLLFFFLLCSTYSRYSTVSIFLFEGEEELHSVTCLSLSLSLSLCAVPSALCRPVAD